MKRYEHLLRQAAHTLYTLRELVAEAGDAQVEWPCHHLVTRALDHEEKASVCGQGRSPTTSLGSGHEVTL